MGNGSSLMAALQQPQAWPHPVQQPIGLVETHISWVLLTGPYAYKLHKAVNLGFLDFTSLEQRLHDCREELRLNRRLSDDLYLNLVAVVASPAGPRVVDANVPVAQLPGPVLEYGLRMRQFPQEALLPQALARGAIQAGAIEALASDLARFHHQAAVAPAAGPYGTPAAVRQPVLDNFKALAPNLAPALQPQLQRLQRWADRAFAQLSPVMHQRLAGGRVRECHGDLHLGNMLLEGERIRVFDCLEFSPALRWIDVISDMAFLVMDLEERGHPSLANQVLNSWLACNGDYGGLQLWRWYVSYRALVRAKVAVLSGDHSATGPAADYLAMAERQCGAPGAAALVLCHGLSGSGKSHLSKRLAAAMGAIRLCSDGERKRWFGLWGLSEEPQRQGDPYAAEVSDALFLQHLPSLALGLLQAGFSVIVDATFLRQRYRRAMAEVAERCAVPLRILDLQVPLPLLQQRIRARQRAGFDPSDADLAVLGQQLQQRQPLDRGEQALSIPVPIDWSLEAILSAVQAPGFGASSSP